MSSAGILLACSLFSSAVLLWAHECLKRSGCASSIRALMARHLLMFTIPLAVVSAAVSLFERWLTHLEVDAMLVSELHQLTSLLVTLRDFATKLDLLRWVAPVLGTISLIAAALTLFRIAPRWLDRLRPSERSQALARVLRKYSKWVSMAQLVLTMLCSFSFLTPDIGIGPIQARFGDLKQVTSRAVHIARQRVEDATAHRILRDLVRDSTHVYTHPWRASVDIIDRLRSLELKAAAHEQQLGALDSPNRRWVHNQASTWDVVSKGGPPPQTSTSERTGTEALDLFEGQRVWEAERVAKRWEELVNAPERLETTDEILEEAVYKHARGALSSAIFHDLPLGDELLENLTSKLQERLTKAMDNRLLRPALLKLVTLSGADRGGQDQQTVNEQADQLSREVSNAAELASTAPETRTPVSGPGSRSFERFKRVGQDPKFQRYIRRIARAEGEVRVEARAREQALGARRARAIVGIRGWMESARAGQGTLLAEALERTSRMGLIPPNPRWLSLAIEEDLTRASHLPVSIAQVIELERFETELRAGSLGHVLAALTDLSDLDAFKTGRGATYWPNLTCLQLGKYFDSEDLRLLTLGTDITRSRDWMRQTTSRSIGYRPYEYRPFEFRPYEFRPYEFRPYEFHPYEFHPTIRVFW